MAKYLIGNIKGPAGMSPTATVEQTQTGAIITITDANGTTTANIRNGIDGTGDPIDLSDYATKLEVAALANNIALADYASKEYVDDAIEDISAPVQSVNGMVGNVVLTIPEELEAGENITIENNTISASFLEEDPIFTSSPAATITQSDIDNWNAAGSSDFSGDYDDLTNKPDLSIYADTADLATVATTGDYDDLTNKPTIPVLPTLATVATSGSYTDLSNKPAIPIYTAGNNITISNGEISATNTTYTAGDGIGIDERDNNAIYVEYGDGLTLSDRNALEVDDTIVATKTDLADYATQRDLDNYVATDDLPTYNAGDGILIEQQVATRSEGLLRSASPTNPQYNVSINLARDSGLAIDNDGALYADIDLSEYATQRDLNDKQDTLTAGTNITISNNVISATDTTYTAGTGIDITGNVISATGGGGSGSYGDADVRSFLVMNFGLGENEYDDQFNIHDGYVGANGAISFTYDSSDDAFLQKNLAVTWEGDEHTFELTGTRTWTYESSTITASEYDDMSGGWTFTGTLPLSEGDWYQVNGYERYEEPSKLWPQYVNNEAVHSTYSAYGVDTGIYGHTVNQVLGASYIEADTTGEDWLIGASYPIEITDATTFVIDSGSAINMGWHEQGFNNAKLMVEFDYMTSPIRYEMELTDGLVIENGESYTFNNFTEVQNDFGSTLLTNLSITVSCGADELVLNSMAGTWNGSTFPDSMNLNYMGVEATTPAQLVPVDSKYMPMDDIYDAMVDKGLGGGGATYTAGRGIEIDANDTISLKNMINPVFWTFIRTSYVNYTAAQSNGYIKFPQNKNSCISGLLDGYIIIPQISGINITQEDLNRDTNMYLVDFNAARTNGTFELGVISGTGTLSLERGTFYYYDGITLYKWGTPGDIYNCLPIYYEGSGTSKTLANKLKSLDTDIAAKQDAITAANAPTALYLKDANDVVYEIKVDTSGTLTATQVSNS